MRWWRERAGQLYAVRVGLAAVKGLAEAARIPVVAVSRLEVWQQKPGPHGQVLVRGSEARALRLGP